MLKRIAAVLLAGVVFIGSFAPYDNVFAEETTETVTESDGTIRGSYGNTTWSIDSDGKLTVEGTGNVKEENANPGWYDYRTEITEAEIKVKWMTDASYLFYDCSNMTFVDVSGFDTRNVTNMNSMFRGCTSLTSLDVSAFNTSNVTEMEWMFYFCSSLTELDVSKFDTANVKNMAGMFGDCSSLAKLDTSGFDTSNVSDMSAMFSYCSV